MKSPNTYPTAHMVEMSNHCNAIAEIAQALDHTQLYIRYDIMFDLFMTDFETAMDQCDLIQLLKKPTSK